MKRLLRVSWNVTVWLLAKILAETATAMVCLARQLIEATKETKGTKGTESDPEFLQEETEVTEKGKL